MNKAIIMGRLTKDPEVRYSSGERSMAIARYTLAVDRRGRRDQNNNQPTADFIPCVAFDRAGEFAEKYFRKGQRVLVEGRIQTGSYTNRDGQKVYTTEVVVESQEFADSKSDGYNSTQQNRANDYYAAGGQGQWSQQGGGAPQGQPPQGNGYGQPAPQNGGGYRGPQTPQGQYQQQSMPLYPSEQEGFMNIPDNVEDEGLPFN